MQEGILAPFQHFCPYGKNATQRLCSVADGRCVCALWTSRNLHLRCA